MSLHSTLAPSAAHRWMLCTGATAATIGEGDSSSEFAREGTAAHDLGERALQYADGNPPRKAEFWIGETISVPYTDSDGNPAVQEFIVDQEMADHVQVYADQVLREPGELIIEETVDLSEVYGVKGEKGTADAIVLDYENDRLYVGDLKYGRGVIVYAKDNWQLYSYAAGALLAYDLMGDWKTITVAIHQPRVGHYDEYTMPVEELREWIEFAKERAQAANALIGADEAAIEAAKTAGDKQCQWCPIKGNCRTLATFVHESVYSDFTSLGGECEQPRVASELDDTLLGQLMARADLIASTVSEWRAEGLRRVQAGVEVPGWKLVQGRAGARKWSDEEAAKKVLKGARYKDTEIYSKKLLTAPQTEKLVAKAKPKVWKKLEALIEQAEGKPALAPESDSRPALKVAESEAFKDITTDAADNDMSDLL